MNRLSNVGIQDGLGGILLTALGAIVLITSNDYEWLTESGIVGPAMLPGVCGVLLVLVGVIQIGHAVLAQRATRRANIPAMETVPVATESGMAPGFAEAMAAEEGTASEDSPVVGSSRRAWLTWVGVAVSVFLVPYVGLVPAIGILAVYLLKFVSQKSWFIAALYAVCLVVGLHLAFVVVLGIPLPMPDWIG